MVNKIGLWIYICLICQVAAAASDVLSTGALIGLICGILFFFTVLVIAFILCLKMRWRHLKRKKIMKSRTLQETPGPSNRTDAFVERLPDIQEEDESITESSTSVRDESNIIVQTSRFDRKEGQQNGGVHYAVATKTSDTDRSTEVAKVFITETGNEIESADGTESVLIEFDSKTNEKGTHKTTKVKSEKVIENTAMTETAPVETTELETEENIVQDIHINNEGENTKDEKSEVLVTRVIENENVLRKDVPHLNSTENIFSEYDPAMTYKTDKSKMSKSDEALSSNFIPATKKDVQSNKFEFTQDDSDLNLKSSSEMEVDNSVKSRSDEILNVRYRVRKRQRAKSTTFKFSQDDNDLNHETDRKMELKPRINKSEGNLIEAGRSTALSRKSSVISRITCKSFEWNFNYVSPYAMSEKLKQEKLERIAKMKKRRLQLMKIKQDEQEKAKRENDLAFEKWKQEKNYGTRTHSEIVDTGSLGSGSSIRYRFWYP